MKPEWWNAKIKFLPSTPKVTREDLKLSGIIFVAFALLFAITAIWVLLGRNKQLKLELADSQQTLKECQHSFEIWSDQITGYNINEDESIIRIYLKKP